MRISTKDILTFDGFFGAKFDILKPRWLPTAANRASAWLDGKRDDASAATSHQRGRTSRLRRKSVRSTRTTSVCRRVSFALPDSRPDLMLSCRSDARIERVQAMACMAAAIRSSLDPSAVACDEVAWPVNVERTRSTRASRGYERAQSGGLARQGRPAGEMGQWRGSRKGRRRAGVGRQPAYSMACRRDGPWSLLEGLGVDCTLARMGSAMPAC